MASECKLCCLLGATDSSDGNPDTHADLHAHQSQLIEGGLIPKEKFKKFALSRLSRKLVKIHGKKRDSGIKCSQCEHSIRPQQRWRANTANSLINHACIHLNKELYACRQCQLKFVSRGGVFAHLQNIHALSAVRANYIDMTDDHQSDIMDMLNLCFGKAPKNQLNVTAFGKQKRNQQSQTPYLKLAYEILSKYQLGNHLKCNLCPSSIIYQKRVNAAQRLLDHARWHLNKPIFTCRFCQFSVSTDNSVRKHLKSSHGVALSKKNFKDESSEYAQEIYSMLDDCFGDVKKERKSVLSNEDKQTRRAQSYIRSRCGTNSLLAERQLRCRELAQRFQRSGKLQCRICHEHLIVVKGAKTKYAYAPMGHALSHFNKILFTCRRCSYNSTSKAMMGLHVRSKHGVPSTNEIDDRTDDFHADVMDMVSKCFDWDMEPKRSGDSISAPIVPTIHLLKLISQMKGNDLKAARHIRASELIRNHSMDGKIICRICSHHTSVSCGESKAVFEHAMTHMDRCFWPYRCKLCSYASVYGANIRHHMNKAHKDNEAEEFEDKTDKSHSEIMEILSKCYDWNIE